MCRTRISRTNSIFFNCFYFVVSKCLPPCSFILLSPPRPPNLENSSGSRHLVPDPIPEGTHLVSSRRHLPFHPFANPTNLEDSPRRSLKHVHNVHIGFIIRKHLPKATDSMLSTLMRDGRGGREGWCHQAGHSGLMTHLACLFPDAQPTRSQCPGV